jgi:salicylate hydroxylase
VPQADSCTAARQPLRVDRTARIVSWFHLPSVAEIPVRFAKRDDRNRWLYSYNPLTVELM